MRIIKTLFKILYNVLYIAFIGALIGVIIYLVCLCVNAFDSPNISKLLNTIATTLTAITSSLSVILTAININETRKQFKNSKKNEVFNYWYKELIIDRHLPQVKKFFDSCNALIDSIDFKKEQLELSGIQYNELLRDKIFDPFTSQYTTTHMNLTSDLQIINSALSNDISNNFSRFQDEFSVFFDNMHIDIEKLHICVNKYRREIIKNLMSYNIKYTSEIDLVQ